MSQGAELVKIRLIAFVPRLNALSCTEEYEM